MRSKMLINPSLACSDWLNLRETVKILERTGIKRLHLDVMDGHYVPNLCMNLDQIAALRKETKMELDVHLMVLNPVDYIPRLLEIGADMVSVHLDTISDDINEVITRISSKMRFGIVLNPDVAIEEVIPWLEKVSFVQLMGVNPGFAGQPFLEDTYKRLIQLTDLKEHSERQFDIQIDGGITLKNGKRCKELGADSLVVGALCMFLRNKPLSISSEEVMRALA